MHGGEVVYGEEKDFPYPLCIRNTESLGSLKTDVMEIKDDLSNLKAFSENHLSELVKKNGLKGKEKVAIYTSLIGAAVTIVKVIFG